VRSSRRSSSLDLIQSRREGDLPWERSGEYSSLDVKGTYPGNDRVNTPCVQTLQSLGTVTGASHQEIQCRLHNPDIESRVMYMCCGGLYDSGDNEKDCMTSVYNWTAWFLNQISLPLLFVFLSCVVCFLLRWSLIWWEQMWLQCQRHFWRMKSHRVSVEEEVSSGSFSSGQ